MINFPSLRKELYLQSFSGSKEGDRSSYESLFDYIVNDDNLKKSYKDKLIDCLQFSSQDYRGSFSLKENISFFSRNMVYDRNLINFLKKNTPLISLIPEYIPINLPSLSTEQFLAWLRLFGEIHLEENLIDIVCLFLEYPKDDESIVILQFAVIHRLIEDNHFKQISSYVKCIENAISFHNESPGFLTSLVEVYEAVRNSSVYSQIEMQKVDKKVNSIDRQGLPFLDDLILKIREEISFINEKGIVLFQFLFYGDPDHSGAGDSGGLATLLRDLGSSISKCSGIAGVITICAYDSSNSTVPYTPIRFPEEYHALVHLPIFLGGSGKEGYLPFQGMIEREMTSFFNQLALKDKPCHPLFHIRYLDSASFVVSRIALRNQIPYVLTLTPDPHRKIADKGSAKESGEQQIQKMNDFNRVLIGDTLLEDAEAIIGIGKNSINTSLIPYFPQLADKKNLILEGIDEGVQIDIETKDVSLEKLFSNTSCTLYIKTSFTSRPVILNVGRLHNTKGQINLLKAWDQQNLWKTHNLFLIGGDFDFPSLMERQIIDFIIEYVNERSYLQGRIRFQGSTTNREIRALQQTLAKRDINQYPDVYVCSSLKEEFGISIIEAMCAGLFVLAPLLGGAKEYIRHGTNGFMINTATSESLGREFCSYVYNLHFSAEKIKAIQGNARETIIQMYSLNNIAEEFVKVYKKIGGVNEE